jgi:hypothetical protein
MIDANTIHAIGKAYARRYGNHRQFQRHPVDGDRGRHCGHGAVDAAAQAGLRRAPSMSNSTMIGTAAAIADSPSDPPIGA